MFSNQRPVLALFLASFLAFPASAPAFALDTPLRDTAVREAYFLGQHRDNALAEFLAKYSFSLPSPAAGPYIQSVTFFTPFALTAVNSSQHVGIYSAQQAQLDHDKAPEIVRIVVQVFLTDSYGPYLVRPIRESSSSPKGIELRPSSFWRDFRLRVLQKEELVIPAGASGQPTFRCNESGCILTGATLTFEYPASAFTEATATVLVTPPEGDPVSIDFDLSSLR